MAVLHTTNKEAFDKIINGKKPVLVDFFATWCGPCQMFGPMIDDMAKKYPNADKVEIVKVDIDEGAAIAEKYDVMSVPTVITFKDGKQVDFLPGLQQINALEAKMDALLK